MKDSFAKHAIRLAGATCRSIGWRPHDFWEATPAEIAAIFTIDSMDADSALNRNDLKALMERDSNG